MGEVWLLSVARYSAAKSCANTNNRQVFHSLSIYFDIYQQILVLVII
ncbi:conserved hypothetical protein [Vibrio cholerae O1 str. 2010EL-1786]|uniref:Uncharacterized protein n=4 Tax=Vibrio cholerae TaxID=666 RepID=Q9KQV7_VIBCH|nr:hypothetical protein VC_1891 [Vibrio cholerae O1 biovar El Tor str. N16961]ABQ21697.1 hypothetical protein VC0395_A1481 [Vibrio cholerae O395]ACP06121.1 conserved hypothetical protein [Vibrio cholerae M66-2]AET26983.1 conserved hypothetical protein [Vibrio cholerae O1 str. 2010EL-1786]EAZ72310.1 hypothetical protein A5C_1922 [Vibrio cholerae NCTC 8457]EAZ75811.1 hypothetical protein A5E_2187 [Vibrio cholerae B33]EET23097.1 conserved hypothetical protein [Vibrio cholerae MO10]EGQ97397.1 hy